MITIKLPIECCYDFSELQRQQSNIIRYSYNRLQEKIPINSIYNMCMKLNNINIPSRLILSGIYKSKNLALKASVIFNKKNFYNRLNNEISKEEYKQNKNMNLVSIGEPSGNRYFKLNIEDNIIYFKPKCKEKINIFLPKLKKNIKNKLLKLQESKIQFSIEVNNKFIYIIYNEEKIEDKQIIKTKENMKYFRYQKKYLIFPNPSIVNIFQ